jgi:hypothetical protein
MPSPTDFVYTYEMWRRLNLHPFKRNVQLIINARPEMVVVVCRGEIPQSLGKATAMSPRRRNEAIVRFVNAKCCDKAVECTSWTHRLPSRLFDCHWKDVVVRRIISEEEECPFRPVGDMVCQAFVYLGSFRVCPDFDVWVELTEEFERNVCDLEFAD